MATEISAAFNQPLVALLSPNQMEWLMPIAALIPLLIGGWIVWLERKRRDDPETAPQKERLLRPPGYSLAVRLDTALDNAFQSLVFACGLFAAAGPVGYLTFLLSRMPRFPIWYYLYPVLTVVFVGVGIALLIRFRHMLAEASNYRLGMRGEQAVAEALNEAANCGYRSFHDFPAEENWNIDHIVAGPQGVFAIETKARRRKGSRGDQPAHEVRFDHAALHFPTAKDTKAIPQAERNARWLANHLSKKTGEPVEVVPLVVLPGWYFTPLEPPPRKVEVMNASYLPGYLRRQSGRINQAQLTRIITALDEKCRDVEF
ncbi:MAG TPA: nuclease-related domain-containing protein [Verrucomicrobiae bacterium]|jgi:hypothetical protein